MDTKEFTLPEFLLAEYPIKNGDPFHDNRHFIIHKGITLIEVIPLDIFTELLNDNIVYKKFKLNDENFILAYHTNNGSYYNIDQYDLLDQAWQWYKDYLMWENRNIDIQKQSNKN